MQAANVRCRFIARLAAFALNYTFHESLILKPLFEETRRKLLLEKGSTPKGMDLEMCLRRLNGAARLIARKQKTALEMVGVKRDVSIPLREVAKIPMNDSGFALLPFENPDLTELELKGIRRKIDLSALAVNDKTQEVQIRIWVSTIPSAMAGPDDPAPSESAAPQDPFVFWIGFFDFPAIDNTRLSQDQRLAVVLNEYDAQAGIADITLVIFPGEYASVKDKPYYQDMLRKVVADGMQP